MDMKREDDYTISEFKSDIREYGKVLFDKYKFNGPHVKDHWLYKRNLYYNNEFIGFRFNVDGGYQEHEDDCFLRVYAYLPPWKEEGLKLTEIIEIYNAKYNRQIDPEIIRREKELHEKLVTSRMSDEEYNEYLSILHKISDFEHPTEELQEIRAANRNYDLRNIDRIRLSLRKYSEFLDRYLSDVLSGKNRGWIDVVPWRDEREIW